MRIRKNIKSVFQRKTSSSFLICQLNRSPWEDDSFFTKGDWDNDLPLNGSLSNSSYTSDSMSSEETMELSFENVEKTPPQSEQEKKVVEIGGSIVFPGMLAQKNYMSDPVPPRKADVGPTLAPVLPKKRGRPRNKPARHGASASSNSCNDIFYYSGFGPSWSKRRGGTKFNPAPQMGNSNGNGNGNGMEITRCSSITKESSNNNNMSEVDIIMLDGDDDDDENNKSENNNDNVVIKSYQSVLEAQRDLDYIEDEDEDEELYGERRARKPIKARSLKSLM